MTSSGRTSGVDHYFKPQADGKPAEPEAVMRSPTLNLRFASGEEKAFPYSDLIWSDFNPSKGILLHFASHTVMVRGRNLEPLYRRVIQFSLAEIIEVSEEHAVHDDDTVTVVDCLR